MKARRLPIVDEYAEDGRVAVYVGENVLVLSELATFAFGMVGDDWVDVRGVAAELVDEFGPPPGDGDGMTATGAVLTQLAEQKLIEIA